MTSEQINYLNEWINDFELVNDNAKTCTFALIILNLILQAKRLNLVFNDWLIDDIVLSAENTMVKLYGEFWY